MARADSQRTRAQFLGISSALLVLVVLLITGFLYDQTRRKRAYEQLAYTDALTGAPNRRAMLEHLNKEVLAGHAPLVAIIDLDHFKSINDAYGHDAGDDVLKAFHAATVQSQQAGEKFGRIGGEEWMMVCTGRTEHQVGDAFQRISRAIQSSAIPGIPPERKITFSMGCARATADAASAIRHADSALYAAKAAGRNQLVIGTQVSAGGESCTVSSHPKPILLQPSS